MTTLKEFYRLVNDLRKIMGMKGLSETARQCKMAELHTAYLRLSDDDLEIASIHFKSAYTEYESRMKFMGMTP